MEFYSNLKRYNENGQRVAVFGRVLSGARLEISIYKCSKKDQFCKKFAREEYLAYLAGVEGVTHPERQIIVIEDQNKPKWSFLNWCRKNFYIIAQDYLSVPDSTCTIELGSTFAKGRHIKLKYLTK